MVAAIGVGAGLIMIVVIIGAKLKYDVYKRNKSKTVGIKLHCRFVLVSNFIVGKY